MKKCLNDKTILFLIVILFGMLFFLAFYIFYKPAEETNPFKVQIEGTSLDTADIRKQIVLVECDAENGGIGSGVLDKVIDDKGESQVVVFTNAHVTGDGEQKFRYCLVSLPQRDEEQGKVQRYEAVPIFIAYEDSAIDFSVLHLIGGDFLDVTLEKKCLSSDNEVGDKVKIFGYPSGDVNDISISEGFISAVEDSQIETTAKADPGNSGGLAVNVSKGCSIGLTTWENVDTSGGLIQTWEHLISHIKN